MSLNSLNRSIRILEKKQLIDKLSSSELKKIKAQKKEREKLRSESKLAVKKLEKFKKLTNEQRSISGKINKLKKQVVSDLSKKKKQAIENKILRLEKKKVSIQEKKFKNSKKYVKILFARRDLVSKQKLIQKVLNSEVEMKSISKNQNQELVKELFTVQEEIAAVSDFLELPIVQINKDGFITSSDLKSKLAEKDNEEDNPGIWEVKDIVEKKVSDNKESFDFVEIYFPFGRMYTVEIPLYENLEWEQVMTAFYNEADNDRLVRKNKSYWAYVLYNFKERKISISLN